MMLSEAYKNYGSKTITKKQLDLFLDATGLYIDCFTDDYNCKDTDVPLGWCIDTAHYHMGTILAELGWLGSESDLDDEERSELSACRKFIRMHKNKKGIKVPLMNIDNTESEEG